MLEERSLALSGPVMRKVLRKLGYRFGNVVVVGKYDADDPESRQRFVEFALAYQEAWRQQEEGKAIIAFMDESYVNTNHNRKQTWYKQVYETVTDAAGRVRKKLVRVGNKVGREIGAGRRLIIVHAITKDGFLEKEGYKHDLEGNDMAMHGASAKEKERQRLFGDKDYETCELIFNGEYEDGDYHKNMNSAKFMHWVERRLFPVCAQRYPGKRVILILDNAGYHHRNKDTHIPASAPKKEVAPPHHHHHHARATVISLFVCCFVRSWQT